MHRNAAQLIVRELITETDRMSRDAHVDHDDTASARFAALRSSLLHIDRRLGGTARFGESGALDLMYQRIVALAAVANDDARFSQLAARAAGLRQIRPSASTLESVRRYAPAVGIGGTGLALGAVLAIPALRRSPLAWIAAIATAAASLAMMRGMAHAAESARERWVD